MSFFADASPKRYYARQQGSYTGKMKFSEFNQSPERATFPTLGYVGQPAVRRGDAPVTVGRSDPKLRDEVVGRVDKLNLPSYTGFVMPKLTAVTGADGAITDVTVTRASPPPSATTGAGIHAMSAST